MTVEIVEMPLDLRPSVKLSGKASSGAADSQAKFILNLVWRR